MRFSLRACACLGLVAVASASFSQAWLTFGGNSQHTGQSLIKSNQLDKIVWTTPVDLMPPYSGEDLLAHYGSPVVTDQNTVVVPVKTGASDGFKVVGRRGSDGGMIWSAKSTYTLPPHGWYPSYNIALLPPSAAGGNYRVAWPESGGRISIRDSADAASSPRSFVVFYGKKNYQLDPATFDNNVKICTPLTVAGDGSVYFGFIVLGANPTNLESGLAKIDASGNGSYLKATTLSGDPEIGLMKMNGAPALSKDGSKLYVVTYTAPYGRGRLVQVNTSTFTPAHRVDLMDPHTGVSALIDSDGTASPVVAPDGSVHVGVLENGFGSNHLRGWSLHFSSLLKTQFTPGAFGWDNTPSIVPAKAVPFYTGSSSYLLFTKYNNYVQGGGDGVNKMALLDPYDTQTDAISGITVMKEVAVQASPTPDANFIGDHPNAVREWCVNTGVIDIPGKCALANCEDGVLYRWDFVTNTLSESIRLTRGIGEAYTSTLIGKDGKVYAINNATLFAIGSVPR